MSGDVQPRKRKDKKKKRESFDVRKSEGELIFSRKSSLQDDEASHGVHVTKLGSDDVLLHVHEEHGTGGHWCAKIIFFSLMAILMGLVCLIILENRGISDVDTPLSESRFSNYFDGWVDEHRDDHDDHHDSHGSLEHDDHDEDNHDEPFEEEVDHSEGDEEEIEEEDDNVTPEEEDEDGDSATAENVTAEQEEEDEEEEEDPVEDDEDNATADVDDDDGDNVTAEDVDDDNVTAEDENITNEATVEQNEDDDDEEDNDNDDDNKTNEDDNVTRETSKPTSQGAYADDDNAFDEEDDDDDGVLDSFETIVDNDAAELEHLKEKARQQAAADSKQNVASAENDLENEADNAPSWASSQIKPKIGSGPQLLEEDDLFEQELRRSNEEMMREFNYD